MSTADTPRHSTGDEHERSLHEDPTYDPGQTAGHESGQTTSLDSGASVTRHEERLDVGTEEHEAGRVRVRKHVSSYPVEETVPRNVEHADTSERVAALEGDSGEVMTLEDGSVSIPLFEEVLVVTKRLVVRERVVVRKSTVIDEYRLQTELQREHVTLETDGDIEVDDQRPATTDRG